MRVVFVDRFGSFSLVPFFRNSPGYEVFSMGDVGGNKWEILADLKPDAIFVDFCETNAEQISRRIGELPGDPRLVIRLHGYEVFSEHMNRVDWSAVSAVVTVSDFYRGLVADRLSAIGARVNVVTIHNGVNLNRFRLQDKSEMDESVAFLSYLNRKKGIALLRTVIMSSPDVMFHIGGEYQEEPVKLYLTDRAMGNVTFHGRTSPEVFFRGKGYVLSTSVSESFGMSIAEGMAMGLTPIVHSWPGADKLWPKQCIWSTFDELKRIRRMDPVDCRAWVEKRYSMERCVSGIGKVLRGDDQRDIA